MKLAEQTQVEEAVEQAEELLIAAEHRRNELMRESEAEAKRRASDITVGASWQARELLDKPSARLREPLRPPTRSVNR